MPDETVELTPDIIGSENAKQAPPFAVFCNSVLAKFYLRQLSAQECDAFRAKLALDTVHKRRDLVITATLCNADGTFQFHPSTIALLKKMDDRDAERLYQKSCELNGLDYVPTKPK